VAPPEQLTPAPEPQAGDAMSPEQAVPSLLQKVSELGARHDIQVLSIRRRRPTPHHRGIRLRPAPHLRPHPGVPERAGRFQLLGRFLEDLQRQGSLAMVRNVHLSASQTPGMVTVELWIDVFGRIS